VMLALLLTSLHLPTIRAVAGSSCKVDGMRREVQHCVSLQVKGCCRCCLFLLPVGAPACHRVFTAAPHAVLLQVCLRATCSFALQANCRGAQPQHPR
jgi:hypothetical protein